MKKVLKIAGGTLLVLLLILILMPFLFRDRIAQEVKNLANRKLKSEMNFSKMSLSFFNHFPSLTLTLTDFSLKSSAPFEKDTLISAGEISFGVNLKSLFGKTTKITRIYFEKAKINILYNEKGAANYNVYESTDTTASKTDTAAPGAELNIDHIYFFDCRVVYSDPSIPVRVVADGLNYWGKSNLTNDIFDLTSRVDIRAMDVIYDHHKYLDAKPVTARLSTRINSRDLSVSFEKNNLMIKDIPLKFTGKFLFEKEGYRVNLNLLSVLEKEFFSARFRIVQGRSTWVSAKVNASLDLGRWSKALDVKTVDLKGLYELNLDAEGNYATGPDPGRLRKDTVLLSIPRFTLMTRLAGGYMKYASLPQPISHINFALNVSCPDSNYRNIQVHVKDLQADFLKNRIRGHFDISSLRDMPVEAELEGNCNLGELRQVIPLDSTELAGSLDFRINVKGNYAPEKKLFPHTSASITLTGGRVKTKYYPAPIENISMKALVTNQTGEMKDVKISVDPLTFSFEGQPFTLASTVSNLDDVDYQVLAKGTIDVGKIYKVFSREGMALDGFIQADLSLKGRQSDAAGGRYERLSNKGTLTLRDISFSSDYFPKPFIIRTGTFRFDRDKIWFDRFGAVYGSSDFALKGALSNVISYALSKGGTLKGDFQLNSDRINVDEFMAFGNAPGAENAGTAGSPPGTNTAGIKPSATVPESGVVIIPSDLDIVFRAGVKAVSFKGLNINNFSGRLDIRKGTLWLNETGFGMVGCKVTMDATYGSVSPTKAVFDFHIRADEFDIKRAYQEVAMIRELAPSAGKAEGIVSLDYSIKGFLDGNMYPVMPSLEGGGVISLKKIKVYGLKLFNDIGKRTEREGLKNPDMSKVDIKSTIRNNTVTLEQFKFKVKGIRLKIAGTTTFDSQLNLKIRIGLGPLGIIGIPLKVTGTMDNLKIRYGRGGDNEEIPDSQYSNELSKELLQKIRSVKEDSGDDAPEKP